MVFFVWIGREIGFVWEVGFWGIRAEELEAECKAWVRPQIRGTTVCNRAGAKTHHIGDREAYFRRLIKSIRPGGRVAIIDFKPDSPEGPPKEFRFPPEKFKSEMGKAGYKLAAQHDFLPRQQFLIFQVEGQPSR